MDLEVRVAVLEVLVTSLLTILYPKEEGWSTIKALFVRNLLQAMEHGLNERYPNATPEEVEAMVEYSQELMNAVFGEQR